MYGIFVLLAGLLGCLGCYFYCRPKMQKTEQEDSETRHFNEVLMQESENLQNEIKNMKTIEKYVKEKLIIEEKEEKTKNEKI